MSEAKPSPFARWFAPETLVQSLGIGLLLTIVSRAAGLGRGVLFARLMDRAELGIWAIAQNTMQMVAVVLVLGIPAGLCRYAARYERAGRLGTFVVRTLGVSFGGCGLVCAVALVFCRPLADLVFQDTRQAQLTVLLCLGAFTLMALNLFQGVLQGLRVYRMNAVMLVTQSLAFAVVAGVLLVLWQPTALAAAWAFLMVSILVTAVPCWMLWKHIGAEAAQPRQGRLEKMWNPLLLYSLGTWGSSALFALWGWLDRYMLLHFDTLGGKRCLEQLGTYHIVENVTGPLLALGAGWSTQVLAHTVHLWEAKQTNEAGRLVQFSAKITVLVMTCMAAGMIVFKQFLLAGIFGDTSMASGEILELVLATMCLLGAQCMIRCYVLCQERVWTVSVVWIGTVLLSILLNIVLIPILHLKGAAITTTISSLVSTWLLMWFTHRAGLQLDFGTWLITLVPLSLILPAPLMLLGLALTAVAVAFSEWLLTHSEKERLNLVVAGLFPRWFGAVTVSRV